MTAECSVLDGASITTPSRVREHHRRGGRRNAGAEGWAGELCNTLFGHGMVFASMNLLHAVQLPVKVSQYSSTKGLSGSKPEILMVERGCLGETCGGSEGRVGVNVIKIH